MKELYVMIEIKEAGSKVYRIQFRDEIEYERKCFMLLWKLARTSYISVMGSNPNRADVEKFYPNVPIEDWNELWS